MPRLLAAAALVLSIAAAPGGMADDAVTAAPAPASAPTLLAQLRDRRAPLERQLAAVRGLGELGPAGAEAWRSHLARELARLGTAADARPRETAVDREIEELRATLAALRAEADLTAAKLEAEGLPALERLRAACAKQEAARKPARTKLAAAHEQATRLVALVEACATGAGDDPALAAVGPFDVAPVRAVAAALEPEGAADADVLARNARLAKSLPPEVAEGTRAVDSVRMLCGLGPLVIDPKLCVAATDHSADMEKHGFFAHESPLPGKKEPWDRARLAGTTASAENIYMGSTSGADAVKAWFLSPGHHKNLLAAGHGRQGLGRSGEHWTQLFGE